MFSEILASSPVVRDGSNRVRIVIRENLYMRDEYVTHLEVTLSDGSISYNHGHYKRSLREAWNDLVSRAESLMASAYPEHYDHKGE